MVLYYRWNSGPYRHTIKRILKIDFLSQLAVLLFDFCIALYIIIVIIIYGCILLIVRQEAIQVEYLPSYRREYWKIAWQHDLGPVSDVNDHTAI